MKHICIVGDSFSADWTVKYPDRKGWVNALADKHDVVNLSQAGCSQYAILKQLQSLKKLSNFDAILLSHTSPYRVYVDQHPVNDGDVLHGNADLIYTDIANAAKTNDALMPLKDYMENWMSLPYQIDIYDLILEKIDAILTYEQRYVPRLNVIHMTHLEWTSNYELDNMLDLRPLRKKHRGDINHYTEEGNALVLAAINKRLDF